VNIHGHGRWPGRGLRRPSPGHGERAPRGAAGHGGACEWPL